MRKKKPLDKLTAEALAAEAVGLSYGKWKAMQQRAAAVKKPQKPGIKRICPQCGKAFIAYHSRRTYCDPKCCKGAFYARHKE